MFCLKTPSDASWALEASAQLDDVLVDHAHCEMKAAANALSLAARFPGELDMVRALTDLAREEIDHFQRVVAILAERGLGLGAPRVDPYAAELRRGLGELPRSTLDNAGLVDRLLVGALIEARSCERFKLLLARPEMTEALRPFYEELFACEARHYRTFVDLAQAAAGAGRRPAARDEVLARLELLSHVEGRIVLALSAGSARATVHG